MDEFLLFYLIQKGRWLIRIDKPHGSGPQFQQHIHLYRKGIRGEYSWNIDGTRHDKKKFPVSEEQIERARQFASEHLKVAPHTLQFITGLSGGFRVTMAAESDYAKPRQLFSTYLRIREAMILFGSVDGALVAVSTRDRHE